MDLVKIILVNIQDWTFYVQFLVCSFSIVILLENVARPKRSLKNIALRWLIVYVACLASDLLFSVFSIYIPFFRGINFTISYLLVISIYSVFFSTQSIPSRVIMGSVSFTFICITLEIASQITQRFEQTYPGNNFMFVRVIAYLLILLFTVIANRHSLSKYSNIPTMSFVLILVEALIINGFVLYKEKTLLGTGIDTLLLYCLVFFYIFSLFSYLLVYNSADEHYKRFKVEVENKLLESDKQRLVVSQEAIDEMHEIRHDIKNQYSIMQTLLSEGKIDELTNYLDNVIKEPIMIQTFVKSGNRTIDSVLNMEKLKASSFDVLIKYDVIVPNEFIFTLSDISRILVNLIDNAIEETSRSKKGGNTIDVKISTREKSLYICIKNPLKHDLRENDMYHLNTSKEDKKNHGFGHKIVARIVDKYNGYIEYSIDNNSFIAEVLLSMKGESINETN